MKRFVSFCCSIILGGCINIVTINNVNATEMSQDPRTCADPRTQFPTPNPPC